MVFSLAIAVLFPGYEYFFIHPAYNELLTTETENEAVRYANYIVRTLGLENQFLTKERLPENLKESFQSVSLDEHLLKLRIFSAEGEVIFSTLAEEIGVVNENKYLRDIFAKRMVYSKVVGKNRMTAEGDVTRIDVVETYVPFMVGKDFGGAIEVYYDITASISRGKQLSTQSMMTTLMMSFGLLLAIILALYRAHMSLLERDRAEEALRTANEVLENRVAERTRELLIANQHLTDRINERAEAQMALGQALEDIKADREKLEGILSSVPDGVVVTDGELNVLHMNAAAESILNTSLEKALGRPLSEVSHAADFINKVSQALRDSQISNPFDLEIPAMDLRPSKTYQVRVSHFVFVDKKPSGIIILIRDVSQEREVERMKSSFLGMAAHELNTPLTTIIGFSELLTEKDTADIFDSEQQKDFLQLIHKKALALGKLVDDLLDVSRMESGRPLTLNCREFSLSNMVCEVIDACRSQYAQHQFQMTLPEAESFLSADQSRLKQVLEHLVSNAVKYSPGCGKVTVDLVSHDDKYELCVSDEGIGMNEEQLAHIFDRFYRADASDTAVQGVGLGMSLVRHIVLAHYGDIHIESHPGCGTRVSISLPKNPKAVYGIGQKH
jgi:PAS domain S-box-containing protein